MLGQSPGFDLGGAAALLCGAAPGTRWCAATAVYGKLTCSISIDRDHVHASDAAVACFDLVHPAWQ
jgi:hypothetical protein